MKSYITGICLSVFLLLCFIPAYGQANASAKASSSHSSNKKSTKQILLISSLTTDSYFTYLNIQSIEKEFERMHSDCKLNVKSMLCASMSEASQWQSRMHEILQAANPPQAIVLLGVQAVITYFSETDPIWKKIPVYLYMTPLHGATLPAEYNIPSVTEGPATPINSMVNLKRIIKGFNVRYADFTEYGTQENVELIRRFFPQNKQIAVITDNTYGGLCYLRNVKNYMVNHTDIPCKYIDGHKLSLQQAVKEYRALPESTAVLLGVWAYDNNNLIYMNNALHSFKPANPELPIFTITGTGINYGVLGGCIPKYINDIEGTLVARRIHREISLNEMIAPDIHSLDKEYRFDYPLLKHYKIPNRKIPIGATIINQEITTQQFFEKYKWQIIATIIIVITLTMLLILSIVHIRNINKLKKNIIKQDEQLRHEKKALEDSQEQLKIAKERAEEANRMKSKFVSNMSHEIRTPLNAIVGFANLLADELKETKPEIQEYVKIITDNSDLLLKLINDILDLSRIESGKTQFIIEPTDVIPYCQNTIRSLKQTTDPGVEMAFVGTLSSLYVKTDITRLQQVLINLLNNAVKYTHQGTIHLDVEVKDNMAQFSVTDTGSGIPLEKQSLVFERFAKLNEYIQGTGLGLSICKMTVERMGGRIWVDPDYTQGARFIFTLPL